MSWFKRRRERKAAKRKAKQEALSGKIPFSMTKGVPIIEVDLNGKKAKLLVDTGASLNILSKLDAKEYGYNLFNHSDSSVVTGIGGSKSMLGVSGASIKIDGQKVRIPFKAIPLKLVRNKLGVVGLLGSRWLNENNYILDYTENVIYRQYD